MSLHSAITSDQLKDRFLWTHPTSQQFWHSTGSMVSRSHFLHNKYFSKNNVWLTFHAQLLSGYETCLMIVIKKKIVSFSISICFWNYQILYNSPHISIRNLVGWRLFFRRPKFFMGPRENGFRIHGGSFNFNLLDIYSK